MTKPGFDSSDQQFLERSRKALDESLENLDAASLSRLNQIRHSALETDGTRLWSWWLPASGLATAAAVLLALNLSIQEPGTAERVDSPLGDLELLASDENLEMLDELEFYAWLETELEG